MKELDRALVAKLPTTGSTDPIEQYKKPLVGRLFLERINRGLRLLGPGRRYARALEIGYGAGAVLLALADACDALEGIDLDADPVAVGRVLEAAGVSATLARGSVLEMPYEDARFDLVVSFSVFEHLREHPRALAETRRVLAPGGAFLLGMPTVNKAMSAAFAAIGFRGIDDHHVTTPREVEEAAAAAGFVLEARDALDVPAPRPFGLRLYHHFLLRKP